MSYISKDEAKRYRWIAATVVALGLLTALITGLSDYPEDGFWSGYIVALYGIGWMAVLIGSVWLGFACLRLYTDFFDVDRPISSERFGASIGIIAVVTFVLMAVAVPNVNLFEESRFSKIPKQREQQEAHHANFKVLVALAILVTGASIASVPTRRFFAKQS